MQSAVLFALAVSVYPEPSPFLACSECGGQSTNLVIACCELSSEDNRSFHGPLLVCVEPCVDLVCTAATHVFQAALQMEHRSQVLLISNRHASPFPLTAYWSCAPKRIVPNFDRGP